MRKVNEYIVHRYFPDEGHTTKRYSPAEICAIIHELEFAVKAGIIINFSISPSMTETE